MPIPPSKDKTRQPIQSQNAEVEKLYESCCGSCGSSSPTNSGITLDDLTPVTKGTDSGQKSDSL
jgi:hypothetical protein